MHNRTEKTMKEADAAHEELRDYLSKAVSGCMGAMPSNSMAIHLKAVQDRAMAFAKDNAESAFTFAGKVCNAHTPQELFTLETQFARDRIYAFVKHTEELYGLIGENLGKPQRG